MRAASGIHSAVNNAASAIMSGQGYQQGIQTPAKTREQWASELVKAIVADNVDDVEKAYLGFMEEGGDLEQLEFKCRVGVCLVTLNIIEIAHYHEALGAFLFLWAVVGISNKEMAEAFLESLRMCVNLVPPGSPLPRFDEELLMVLACPENLETAKSRVMALSGRELGERFHVEWLRIARWALARYESKELELEGQAASSSTRGKARL